MGGLMLGTLVLGTGFLVAALLVSAQEPDRLKRNVLVALSLLGLLASLVELAVVIHQDYCK
jgi:hypothetical protein